MANRFQILCIGYQTKPLTADVPAEFVPKFEPKSGKNPKTSDELQAEWVAEFQQTPYGATMSRCMIIDPAGVAQEFTEGKAVYRPKGFPKDQDVPVVLQVAGWLEKTYGKTVANDLAQQLSGDNTGGLMLLGFNPRGFVKQLGIEAARLGSPAKLGFWFANSDYKDMGNAILPEPYSRSYELELALKACGLYKPGFVPGLDARTDAVMSLRIALFLGLLRNKDGLDEFLAEEPEQPAEPVAATESEPAAQEVAG